MGVAGIVDPAMGEDYDPEILKVMTEVALMSAASRKNDRPTMKVKPYLLVFKFTANMSYEEDLDL
jgi:hypothetical protein